LAVTVQPGAVAESLATTLPADGADDKPSGAISASYVTVADATPGTVESVHKVP
jgi:hypothetical protein